MKGDSIVEMVKKVSDSLLFIKVRIRNLDAFHSFNVNTLPISYSIYMRFQQNIDEIMRSEKRIIETRIRSYPTKNVISRAHDSLRIRHF